MNTRQAQLALSEIRIQSQLLVGYLKGIEEHLPPLHQSSNMSMSLNEVNHLRWIYYRMIDVHGESPEVEYICKMRQILGIPDPESEPIYEWQWVIPNGDVRAVARSSFLTEDEFYKSNLNALPQLWFKDESTKRERVK